MPLFLAFALLLLAGASAHADSGPHPPCEGAPFPPYPEPGLSPTLRVWESGDLGRHWVPPACTGWTTAGFTALVVTAARFRYDSGVDGLLRRVGAISESVGIRYWSTTRKQWKTLIVSASALTGPDGSMPRVDFLPDEIRKGDFLYFQQEENLLGNVIYRLRMRSASSAQLVYEIENTSTVKGVIGNVFQPGDIQGLYFLEHESRGLWRYYSLLRIGKRANWMTMGNKASYLNRAMAMYRHLVGIQTDREPPISP